MKKAALVCRMLLGLIFVVFGFNGFFQFLPMPPMPEAAGAFLGGLFQSGYFFPVLKGTEIVGGLMLLSGMYVPLALTILAPIVLQIFLFHFFLAPSGLALPVVMVGMEIFLAWSMKEKFRGVLSRK
ncbi:MAG: acyltransferase [Bacteriovoracia bacterium]